jgi:transposase
MGKRTNQNFVSIPHARFIQMIQYKAELAGIAVLVTEEPYTSKASFLDRDEMPVYNPNRKEKPQFSGKRIERGLYRAADGTLINADCNGSYMPGLSRPLTYSCSKYVLLCGSKLV